MEIKLYDVVSLKTNFNNLKENSIGTVVEIYNNGDGYEVEFLDDDGYVIESIALSKSQIRKLSKEEIDRLN